MTLRIPELPTTGCNTGAPTAFETHDLALAAYLRCREYSLLDVRREPSGRCAFVFGDRPTRQRDVTAFYDAGTVPALQFAENIRMLKARTRVQ
jgi:Domain of unknown function (DUF5659)